MNPLTEIARKLEVFTGNDPQYRAYQRLQEHRISFIGGRVTVVGGCGSLGRGLHNLII